MTPNVPISTDSLYKFAATFGLVLIIASLVSSVIIVDRSNSKIIEAATELFELQKANEKVPDDWVKGIRKRIDVAVSDRSSLTTALAISAGIGMALSIYGFAMWARVQPLQDELLKLQVERARKEIGPDSSVRVGNTKTRRRVLSRE